MRSCSSQAQGGCGRRRQGRAAHLVTSNRYHLSLPASSGRWFRRRIHRRCISHKTKVAGVNAWLLQFPPRFFPIHGAHWAVFSFSSSLAPLFGDQAVTVDCWVSPWCPLGCVKLFLRISFLEPLSGSEAIIVDCWGVYPSLGWLLVDPLPQSPRIFQSYCIF